ncbi:phospholipase D-like domain-containing protein [Candidatus Halobeggiatoa sp. HSG11]|nr:phospholipase D-like domain-containing protein [Candidatus Halobeggiatoa sp. HSG11]
MLRIIEDIYTQVGTNYKLEKINIISPYFSKNFSKSFLSNSENYEISFVTDISCSEKQKKKIEKKVNSVKFYKSNRGMLHAKCYLFHFKSKSDSGIKYIFLWGSANATYTGFTENAEIYSWLEFTDKSDVHKKLIEYFKQIDDCEIPEDESDSKEIKGFRLSLSKENLIIELPSLTFVNYDKYSTFDLWVQRGYLYVKDPVPLKFNVTLELNKAIPLGDIEKIFTSNGTLKRSEPKRMNLDYSNISELTIR